ncbi:FecR domain-containing protein [Algibacter sp. 2305UL17-15]|uniref:FecR family protein n=1 Tax=Algibacter sp. 2305UL17-15 TaxID=3231268 RepID=UPI0034590BFC
MKYIDYTEDDFIKDEYFQKWVLNPDAMTSNFWTNWLRSHPEKQEIIKSASYFIRLIHSDKEVLPEEDFDKMWQVIVQKRETPKHYRLFSKSSKILLQRIAAILVIGFAISYGTHVSGIFNFSEKEQINVAPRITLELEDGTVKFLDEMVSEVLTDKNGHTIISHEQSLLSYKGTGNEASETLVYNQLTVPYGKKFELLLSDGSHVYLNSGSKLRYPVKFLKNKPRDVFLDGEAYFSVTKDNSRLFTVITDELNTQVYGTEFNVSSYKNEKNTSTVLVEGSVGVYKSNNHEGDAPIMIKPGKRAVLEGGTIEVDKVNINKYIAWKEGKLHFINDRFDVIVKELERHFNVTINNEFFELNEKEFTGTFTEETLDEILRIFKEHSGFTYTVNGDNYKIVSN